MKYYVRPTVDGENFTAGKLYEIQHVFGGGRVVVLNDAKEEIIVRCDGVVSARLDWRGKFERVNIPDAQEAMESAERAAAQAIRDLSNGSGWGSGWRIEKDGVFIASGNFKAAENHIVVNGKTYTESQIAKLEKDAADYKADCIKAEKVIDQLYEIITEARNHDQLISAIRTSKVFSDAFIELQKTR